MQTRGLAVVVIVLAALATNAAASTIVVMSEPATAGKLGSALQLTLTGRGVAIATLPAPDGALRMDRAAAAQRAAVTSGADLAVWIDGDAQAIDVCAVSSDGRYFRHAPLPLDMPNGDAVRVEPRVFAAIATSLIDELIAPPDAGFDVHVDVHVEPKAAPAVTGFAPPSFAPPSFAPPAPGGSATATATPPARVRSNKTLFEIGPMASPVTIGLEGEIAFPINDSVRLGAFGVLNTTLDDDGTVIWGLGSELRFVGRGTKHWDIGVIAGMAAADHYSDTIRFGGLKFSRAWEGAGHGTSFSLSPLVVNDGLSTIPGIYASMHWMLSL